MDMREEERMCCIYGVIEQGVQWDGCGEMPAITLGMLFRALNNRNTVSVVEILFY